MFFGVPVTPIPNSSSSVIYLNLTEWVYVSFDKYSFRINSFISVIR